jgi:cytochrome c oxidase subunit 3
MSVLAAEDNKINPKKFALWLGLASIIMLFAGLTSALILRSYATDWTKFKLPQIFWINTAVIVLSSASMQWAYTSFKKYQYNTYKIALFITTVLGFVFICLQYMGYLKLASIGIFYNGTASGSYLYVISFVHLLHVAAGLVVLLSGLIRSLFKSFNPNRLINVELMATYWHFVDILWLYLIILFSLKLA